MWTSQLSRFRRTRDEDPGRDSGNDRKALESAIPLRLDDEERRASSFGALIAKLMHGTAGRLTLHSLRLAARTVLRSFRAYPSHRRTRVMTRATERRLLEENRR